MSASPQQYCLRWNNYQNNLTNVFDQLLQSEAFVDVTLASDGESLKAHKMILSACSPYFQQLFFDNPCSHPIVILKDVKWEELKAVVEFMYRGEINVSQEQLAPLLKVAELLKVRGLADVSRGSSAEFVAAAAAASGGNGNGSSAAAGQGQKLLTSALGGLSGPGTPHPPGTGTPSLLHPSLLLHASPHLAESDGEATVSPQPPRHPSLHGSPSLSSASSLHRHLQNPQFSHHSLGYSAYANGHHVSSSTGNNNSSNGGVEGLAHRNSSNRKRRRISAPLSDDNLSLSPSDTVEDDQLEIDYDTPSPAIMGLLEAGLLGANASGAGTSPGPLPVTTTLGGGSGCGSGLRHGSSSANASTGIRPPSSSSSLNSSSAGPSSLLNFHNAALAAAAAAAAGANSGSSSSSAINDMDLKPGIREMIREEERAKMLESSHGWLGPSGASALSDSYQYQIQSLWQKCWSTNQSGMVQALRFRERGPLKSWRPETMADAIFSVLREGLSLSQAARKYDIPYPTFVLYANRVHNMLGPSNDGSSDLRPKGRGRPQRILLGSWPEDHIHGVIRAVVFRDATKDDLPFGFGRELCIPPQPGSSHGSLAGMNNGLDMSIHAPFLHGLHGHGHRRSGGGGGSSSYGGSSNENSMNMSAFKVHAELGIGASGAASASNSPLPIPLPLLDDANGARDLDLLREEREQAILRAMKKSGDDDEDEGDLDDGEDDRDLIAEMVSRRRASQKSGNATNRRVAGASSAGSGRNANAESLDRILMNSRPAPSTSAPATAISLSPELIRVKKEKDLFATVATDQDDLEEYEQDEGLFIAEEESRSGPEREREPNENDNAITNSEPVPVLQIENENDNEAGCLVIVEGQSGNENNNDEKDKSATGAALISDQSEPQPLPLPKAQAQAEGEGPNPAQEIDQNRNCSDLPRVRSQSKPS